MHLLLLRPEGRAQSLAEKLAALGHRSTQCPMVSIETLTPPPAPFDGAVAAFFVSRTAVEMADQALAGHWPGLPCFAVGAGTAEALSGHGVKAWHPAKGAETSEGVLALPQWRQLPPGPVVIVKGEGGREAFAQAARGEGREVRDWPLYRRTLPDFDGESLLQGWRRNGVDAILATSGEILENLFRVAPLAHHDWLHQVLWLVPVERVAQRARQLGCQRIWVLGGAGDDAILGRIAKTSHYGEDPTGP
ncbi:uroporphyrinogen-III synthase [Ferrimonas marina]|uniref:Uroporphyrinogen-III synthase n=1 Tax=Ferrimonas marina TaxID=299255 RepID=A0A1M5XQ69_9GAMM|nr:uroporphyrinogen-III synthase [Ferrimonas marina]SHI01961.1 uroporphyrinogen-III synthase [Ferrimonas marina]